MPLQLLSSSAGSEINGGGGRISDLERPRLRAVGLVWSDFNYQVINPPRGQKLEQGLHAGGL